MLDQPELVDQFRELSSRKVDLPSLFKGHGDSIRTAILIREVEEAFLRLFGEGRMNGTVHTCVGQEFSAVMVAGALREDDWLTSNHRCHGHFIAKTGNWQGLVDELMGLRSGVCAGVGSSQHLYSSGFLSNGPQGSLVPVATGIALHLKSKRANNIAVSFVGEGTLGQGNIYETMNLATCLGAPQLIVCENNLYSQSTPQAIAIAGDLESRARAFELELFESNTWDIVDLSATAKSAIDYVRNNSKPAFLIVRTYRLNAHSKGDDDRNRDEVREFREADILSRLTKLPEVRKLRESAKQSIQKHIENSAKEVLELEDYVDDQLPCVGNVKTKQIDNRHERMNLALNAAYHEQLERGSYFLGEDIADPYGGAFKVSAGFSTAFRNQVITTPISEEAITGVGIGLSMMGNQTFVEIMFGDFLTHTFDQVVSNASKFHHMYAFQTSAPVRIRAPMGGKRGYGPTHSQCLEKHFLGIDNFAVVALTSLVNPADTIEALAGYDCPALIVENKLDYGRFLWQIPEEFNAEIVAGDLGSVAISPKDSEATCTIVVYGGLAREIADGIADIFVETEEICEVIVPLCLHPLSIEPILNSAQSTGKVVVMEEGSTPYGWGSEVLARLQECGEVT